MSENESDIFIEVLNIHYDSAKYEDKESFLTFIDRRLERKYQNKSNCLEEELKKRIFILPVIYGMTNTIIKSCYTILKGLPLNKNYNSFEPLFFGNIQGTYFDLFEVDDVFRLPSPNED